MKIDVTHIARLARLDQMACRTVAIEVGLRERETMIPMISAAPISVVAAGSGTTIEARRMMPSPPSNAT